MTWWENLALACAPCGIMVRSGFWGENCQSQCPGIGLARANLSRKLIKFYYWKLFKILVYHFTQATSILDHWYLRARSETFNLCVNKSCLALSIVHLQTGWRWVHCLETVWAAWTLLEGGLLRAWVSEVPRKNNTTLHRLLARYL